MPTTSRRIDPLYLKIFWKSLLDRGGGDRRRTLIIGFPVALAISFAPPRLKPILLLLVILPFWTNLLIRTYAMIAVLRNPRLREFRSGISLGRGRRGRLGTLGLGNLPRFQPLTLLYNDAAVIIGIVYVYLPFMVLPLYATLERWIAPIWKPASISAPARWRTMASIVVPLAKPGIVSGVILVFIPALGMFLISDLLGGPTAS